MSDNIGSESERQQALQHGKKLVLLALALTLFSMLPALLGTLMSPVIIWINLVCMVLAIGVLGYGLISPRVKYSLPVLVGGVVLFLIVAFRLLIVGLVAVGMMFA